MNKLVKKRPITKFKQLDLSGYYTYADYLTWRFKERVELIKGMIFKMSPAPNMNHQRISTKIVSKLDSYLDGHKCEVFHAPFDVRLPVSRKKGRVDTVVQPDVCVVCDEKKLEKQGCNGAPDLVIEILSPGNSKTEMRDKYSVYEESGVKEYWLIDPANQAGIIYSLDKKGKYIGSPFFTSGQQMESKVIKGFKFEMDLIFPE